MLKTQQLTTWAKELDNQTVGTDLTVANPLCKVEIAVKLFYSIGSSTGSFPKAAQE